MTAPYFISLDGPKGTGKSSLIQEVYKLLKQEFRVSVLVEKELDPFRNKTKAILTEYKHNMTKSIENELLYFLAKGRKFISEQYIKNENADIILIDRWYPSDAVFRKLHNYKECLQINKDMGVMTPDLIVATVCDPIVSLCRANERSDGLRSLVIDNLEDQIRTSNSFEEIAETEDWFVLRTEPALDEVVKTLIKKIQKELSVKKRIENISI